MNEVPELSPPIGRSSADPKPIPLRVLLVNCREDGIDETPFLQRAMDLSDLPNVRVEDPNQADLILLAGILEDDTFANLRRNKIWREYPGKCFGYSETDNVPSLLRGVYASATRWKGAFGRMQSSGYVIHRGWEINEPPPSLLPAFDQPKQHLISFVGRKSHPLRKKLLLHPWASDEVLIVDQTGRYGHFGSHSKDDTRQAHRLLYWETMIASKFALCPRGAGASSVRLFEAMQAGVAPVIVSDSWIPPHGPDWDRFALFIPQRHIGRIHEIVKARESEFAERGRRAMEAYREWFTDEAIFRQIVGAIRRIEADQVIPESWFARASALPHAFEWLHQWRHKLPGRTKQMLLRLAPRK